MLKNGICNILFPDNLINNGSSISVYGDVAYAVLMFKWH